MVGSPGEIDPSRKRRAFLQSEFRALSIQGAFQRASIYTAAAQPAAREMLRKDVEGFLDRSLERYQAPVRDAEHLSGIEGLADAMTQRHQAVLKDGRFRLGIAQKALNLFLKYCWCAGWISEPPHCPLDGIVIQRIPSFRDVRWTRMDDPDLYRDMIDAPREVAAPHSLAVWELDLWNSKGRRSDPAEPPVPNWKEWSAP